ncbi:hypothetical protein OUZ56_007661 [Daphnia magna]|uniref:Uncharacterized protein n=1 Tax=Daphnia magna TaxID=35525 RepID=A0ABR0AAN3_9CRUS|nr:hypothetical protein OUZ56_007661 [Daphnia magna]
MAAAFSLFDTLVTVTNFRPIASRKAGIRRTSDEIWRAHNDDFSSPVPPGNDDVIIQVLYNFEEVDFVGKENVQQQQPVAATAAEWLGAL